MKELNNILIKDNFVNSAKYINKSEFLRSEINLESDPFKMLDKALLCIAEMTGDIVFYETNKIKVINSMCNFK